MTNVRRSKSSSASNPHWSRHMVRDWSNVDLWIEVGCYSQITALDNCRYVGVKTKSRIQLFVFATVAMNQQNSYSREDGQLTRFPAAFVRIPYHDHFRNSSSSLVQFASHSAHSVGREYTILG